MLITLSPTGYHSPVVYHYGLKWNALTPFKVQIQLNCRWDAYMYIITQYQSDGNIASVKGNILIAWYYKTSPHYVVQVAAAVVGCWNDAVAEYRLRIYCCIDHLFFWLAWVRKWFQMHGNMGMQILALSNWFVSSLFGMNVGCYLMCVWCRST